MTRMLLGMIVSILAIATTVCAEAEPPREVTRACLIKVRGLLYEGRVYPFTLDVDAGTYSCGPPIDGTDQRRYWIGKFSVDGKPANLDLTETVMYVEPDAPPMEGSTYSSRIELHWHGKELRGKGWGRPIALLYKD